MYYANVLTTGDLISTCNIIVFNNEIFLAGNQEQLGRLIIAGLVDINSLNQLGDEDSDGEEAGLE